MIAIRFNWPTCGNITLLDVRWKHQFTASSLNLWCFTSSILILQQWQFSQSIVPPSRIGRHSFPQLSTCPPSHFTFHILPMSFTRRALNNFVQYCCLLPNTPSPFYIKKWPIFGSNCLFTNRPRALLSESRAVTAKYSHSSLLSQPLHLRFTSSPKDSQSALTTIYRSISVS